VAYYSNGRPAAEAIVDMWKKVGLNAQIEVLEQAAITEMTNAGTQVITNWSATSTLGDPDGYLWRNWGPENTTQQKGYWKPEEFNKLGQEARSILDQDKRYKNYQRMMDVFEEDAPGTVCCTFRWSRTGCARRSTGHRTRSTTSILGRTT
jgi:peptide/nickel transport system substrate-binding protein